MSEEKKFEPIPAFDNCHCKGHANYMLDCTYEKEEDRRLMRRIMDNRIMSHEKNIKKS